MQLFRILQIFLVIMGLGLLIFVHEFGHFITSKLMNIKVLEFMIGLPGPKLFSFKRGETTFGITAIPLGGYVKTVGSDPYEEISEEEKKRSLEHSPVYKKSIVVLAGPFMNFIFAILIMFLTFKFIGAPTLINSNKVGALIKGKPAIKAGIKPGDRITSINGEKISNWFDLEKAIKNKPEKKITIDIKSDSTQRKISLKTIKNNDGRGLIGIKPVIKIKPLSLLNSIKFSFSQTWLIISKTSIVIFNALTGKPHELVKSGRSIVGVVYVTSRRVTSLWWYLLIIAFLNVAIGFFNLLPIPPLDAGKLAIYMAELIKGSRLSKKSLIAVNSVGLALILALAVYFIVKDVIFLILA